MSTAWFFFPHSTKNVKTHLTGWDFEMMKKQEWGWDGDLGQNGSERLCQSMATHSSILAWRILWTEKPGGLLSMGSHQVGHDWSDLAAAAANPGCKNRVLPESVDGLSIPRQNRNCQARVVWSYEWRFGGFSEIWKKKGLKPKTISMSLKECYCQNFKKLLYILVTTKKNVFFFFFKN